MKRLLATLTMMTSTLAFGGWAHAATITYSGTLTDTPTYHRPSYTNTYTPAFNCSDCGFQSEGISVATSGAYTFSIVSDNFTDQVDILYSGAFNPTAPMTNYDGPYSYPLYRTGKTQTLNLNAGTQYYWVTSTDFGYTNDNCAAACTFTTSVSGPGAIIIASVPEPSTWGMLFVGLGMIGFAARRRQNVRVTYA